MAKKPTDLTAKTWNKLKGLTVPKTGLGDKLEAFLSAKAKTENFQLRNMAAFNAAADAVQAAQKHIAVAQGKCNKTLHKETIEVLDAYLPLLKEEGSALHKAFVAYQGMIDERKHVREASLKVLTSIKARMVSEGNDAVDAIKKASDKADAAVELKAGSAKVTALQADADKSCATWRISKTVQYTPHADDRGDETPLFLKLTTLINDVIGARKHAEATMVTEFKTHA